MANHNVNFMVDGVDAWCYDGEKYEPGVDHETSGDRAFVEALGAAQAAGVVKVKSPSQTVKDIMSSAVQSEAESKKIQNVADKARAEARKEIEQNIKDPDHPLTAADLVAEADELGYIEAEEAAAQAAVEEAL
jgi:hypothetical protein